MLGGVKDSVPVKLYPLIITETFDATREFYVDRLGSQITFDMPNYLQIRFGEPEAAPELAFMRAGIENAPPGAPFTGAGLVVSVPVESADAYAKTLPKRRIEILGPPEDRPWRWRSFHVQDPAGVILDFFHPLTDG